MLGRGNTSLLPPLLWGALLCSMSCSFQVAVRMRKVGCSLLAVQLNSTFLTASAAHVPQWRRL